MTTSWRTARLRADEYAAFYAGYVAEAGAGDVVEAMARQLAEWSALLGSVPEALGDSRYAPGKWSVKEVVGHVTDAERVFAHRALWFARQSPSALPGFDENAWVPAAAFGRRALADVAEEFAAVRRASLALFASLDDAAAERTGVANEHPISVRALARIVVGHAAHHARILRERYLGDRGRAIGRGSPGA
jgi:hypothetical protein